ncbi:DUF3772 domain-containing protein [Beijerinckia indica]|uniref:MscS Mechanosensitive ion channel n=1 Tax=Beijerinckia indica subsp. indica (strain ATCC 9039 / DSM 1715 / NCIMB 8712) TaxID=395963 RepID=B2ID17_BEII9|nr:DUF3772 domain-containing protein [Beijerinckia indica]ACB96782.1 MscS Mechanosensitive ion channel [Beijerinckia indica subsp. indica ATCC 9039]
MVKFLAFLLCLFLVASLPIEHGVAAQTAPAAPAAPAGPAAPDSASAPTPLAVATPALPPQWGRDLDQVHAGLDQIDQSLQRHDLRADDFDTLQAQIPPLQTKLNDVIGRLTPRLAGVKQRLDQLGPKPADDAPPESPAVTADRADQQKNYTDTDELLKRAKLLAVQADQANNFIISQRRGLITRSLFARVKSPLAPSVWMEMIQEVPREIGALELVFKDGFAQMNAVLIGWRMPAFWGSLAGLALLYWPAWRLSFKILSRESKITTPNNLQKAAAAWWSALVVMILPGLVVFGVGQIFAGFGINSTRLQPFFTALGLGALHLTSVAAVGNGFLALRRPSWRLIELNDARAQRILTAALILAFVVASIKVVEALNEIIVASLPFAILTRGFGALFGALVIFVSLWGATSLEADEDGDAPAGNQAKDPQANTDYIGIARILLWGVAIVVVAATLSGFIAFANFLLQQVLWVTGVVCIFIMAMMLSDSVIVTSINPTSRFGHRLITKVGLHRQTIEIGAILLSGAMRVLLLFVAIFFLLAPWGLQSNDVSNDLGAAFFGFKVGGVTISLSSIIMGIAVFTATFLAVKAFQKWLDKQLLPKTRLDAGLRNSIGTSLGYLAIILAVASSSAYLGLNFERLALLAGALSVGIGFGLQSIINNFVSGLILLWERAVRVGDWIVVGGEQGFVRKINVRSTEIETFDRAAVIIPNSNIISGVVKNLVRNDTTSRVLIPITVSATANPEQVRSVLLEIAKANEMVLSLPSPQVFFIEVTASSLTFELNCYVGDVITLRRVKSDLYFEIYRRFKEEKFFSGAPADPTVVDIKGLGPLSAMLSRADGPLSADAETADSPSITDLQKAEVLLQRAGNGR